MLKLIFLDFDGVLNSNQYFNSYYYFNLLKENNIQDAIEDVFAKAPHFHIDPQAIELINQLVEQSGAKVIVSSSWRKVFALDKINTMLGLRGANFQCVDITSFKFGYRYRGYDIKEYLSDLKQDKNIIPKSFVIIDDIDEFSNYQPQFVQTSMTTGFTIDNLNRALKILK